MKLLKLSACRKVSPGWRLQYAWVKFFTGTNDNIRKLKKMEPTLDASQKNVLDVCAVVHAPATVTAFRQWSLVAATSYLVHQDRVGRRRNGVTVWTVHTLSYAPAKPIQNQKQTALCRDANPRRRTTSSTSTNIGNGKGLYSWVEKTQASVPVSVPLNLLNHQASTKCQGVLLCQIQVIQIRVFALLC